MTKSLGWFAEVDRQIQAEWMGFNQKLDDHATKLLDLKAWIVKSDRGGWGSLVRIHDADLVKGNTPFHATTTLSSGPDARPLCATRAVVGGRSSSVRAIIDCLSGSCQKRDGESEAAMIVEGRGERIGGLRVRLPYVYIFAALEPERSCGIVSEGRKKTMGIDGEWNHTRENLTEEQRIAVDSAGLSGREMRVRGVRVGTEQFKRNILREVVNGEPVEIVRALVVSMNDTQASSQILHLSTVFCISQPLLRTVSALHHARSWCSLRPSGRVGIGDYYSKPWSRGGRSANLGGSSS